jgi:hypothetical protein
MGVVSDQHKTQAARPAAPARSAVPVLQRDGPLHLPHLRVNLCRQSMSAFASAELMCHARLGLAHTTL